MSVAFTPSLCHIDLSAIAHNFKLLGEPERLMPVIKADAYGHGLTEVAQVLDKSGAIRFAVGYASEGAILRSLGHKQEIILLIGCLNEGDWEQAVRHQLTPLVGSFADLKYGQAVLGRYPKKTQPIALKVDTGMSRLGFNLTDLEAVCGLLAQTPNLEPKLLISHLACADVPEEANFTKEQTAIFDQCYERLKAKFPTLARSLDNSAATLDSPGYDIARPGLALYGGNPLPGLDASGLRWAMAVSTPILHIREIAAGQSVSYGRIFKAEKDMRIAVAACGYATGYARNLSNKAQMLVNGQRARQIGRICMSMTMLDVTDIPDVKKGDHAWIMGGEAKEGQQPITALELANELGTIPYEILCLMGELNPRVFSGLVW